jgi:hypothetical protein
MNSVEESPATVPVLRRCVDLLVRPVQAFRGIRGEPPGTAAAWYLSLLLASFVPTVVIGYYHYQLMLASYQFGYYEPLAWAIAAALILPVILFLVLVPAFSLLIHGLVLACGGKGGLVGTLAVILYATAPLLLTFWIFQALWLFQVNFPALLIPLVLLWAGILAIAGLRETHGISAFRAAVPFVVIAVLVLALWLVSVFILFPDPCGGGRCDHVTAATAACSGGNISVTYQGGVDAPTLVNITAYDTTPSQARVMGGTAGVLPVGSVLVLPGPFSAPVHVIAFAHYTDGTDQVILDTWRQCSAIPGQAGAP